MTCINISAVQATPARSVSETESKTIGRTVSIDFTRSGWRRLNRINQKLGALFIRPFVMKSELAEYIAAHEASGVHFDTEGEDIRYDHGIHLIIRKMQGVWHIVDVYLTEEPVAYKPIFFWQRIKCGIDYVLAKFVIGWRAVMNRVTGQKRNESHQYQS